MRILIAPDKFKGSLTAAEAAAAIAEGALRVYPDAEAIQFPVADGGEGTLEAAVAAGYEERLNAVVGPDPGARWARPGPSARTRPAAPPPSSKPRRRPAWRTWNPPRPTRCAPTATAAAS